MKTAALILAAGRSKRFGNTNKLLALLDGKPIAQYAAEAVSTLPLSFKIAVVSQDLQSDIFDGFDRVLVGTENPSQSLSLSKGVEQALIYNPDQVLILLADMPFVTPKLMQNVIEKSTSESASACTDGSKILPPACFPKRYFSELQQLSGDQGAQILLRKLNATYLVEATPYELRDIDTLGDLHKANSFV